MCDICQNWPRGVNENTNYARLRNSDGLPLLPNHHPNCPHYNDSLIDVWKVTVGGVSCFQDDEEDALECASDEEFENDKAVITKEKMHREIFENLPEFNGF